MPAKGTILEVLAGHARRAPDAVALVEADHDPLTYGGLLRQIGDVGDALRALGFGPGDRIATALPQGGAMVTALFGVASACAVAPLNPDLTAPEYEAYLRTLRADGLMVAAGTADPARAAAGRAGLAVIEIAPDPGAPAGVFRFTDPAPIRPPGDAPARPGPDDFAVLLLTTGTTARPKVVPLSHRVFRHRAFKNGGWVRLGPEDRCLLFMPPFHAHGINMGIAPPLAAGGSIVAVARFDADSFFDHLARFRPTWYTASPTHHRAILARAGDYGDVAAAARLRFVRSGAQHLAPAIREGLARAFRCPVIETYNTSETGQLAGARLDGDDTETLWLSDEVAILDDDGNRLPAGMLGEIAARGPAVFSGYEGEGVDNSEVFAGEWCRTGDLGRVDEAGRLTLAGRKTAEINRGGEKIAPLEVARVLESHADVEGAVVVGLPHPTLGEQPAAVVIRRPGAALGERTLREFAAGRLAAFKVPRPIVFLETMPLGPTGKPDLTAIRARIANAPARGSGDREPSPLEARLLRLWRARLHRGDIGLDDDFFVLGGDSLQAIELFLRVEEELGTPLPPSALLEAGTVAEMARRIEGDSPGEALVALKPGGTRPPFFCVHGGDGHVIGFRHLANLLGDDQPFYALQPPWTFANGPLPETVGDMAETYIAAMRAVQPRGPYALGGYSFGGAVAYEMACRLRRAGEPVALLAILDSRLKAGNATPLGAQVRGHLQRLAALDTRGKAAYVGSRLGPLLRRVLRHLRRVAGMPPLEAARDAHAAGRRLTTRQVQAVARAAARGYAPAPAYDGPAVLIKTALPPSLHADAHDTWGRLMEGRLAVVAIGGEHTEILGEPHVRDLAAALSRHLRAARARTEAA
ncbi:MAG TPA: non-ribosomal peptide synthetase [Alphaproteobacteria bacterium]